MKQPFTATDTFHTEEVDRNIDCLTKLFAMGNGRVSRFDRDNGTTVVQVYVPEVTLKWAARFFWEVIKQQLRLSKVGPLMNRVKDCSARDDQSKGAG